MKKENKKANILCKYINNIQKHLKNDFIIWDIVNKNNGLILDTLKFPKKACPARLMHILLESKKYQNKIYVSKLRWNSGLIHDTF